MSAAYPTSELAPGSFVVERYVYTRNGKSGVQWLAQVVSTEGLLLLMRACRTRQEALNVISRATGREWK